MVIPKPHWNLFLRWLRKAPKARVRGSGTSFFSRVAPTTQLLSTVPMEVRKAVYSFSNVQMNNYWISIYQSPCKFKGKSLIYSWGEKHKIRSRVAFWNKNKCSMIEIFMSSLKMAATVKTVWQRTHIVSSLAFHHFVFHLVVIQTLPSCGQP